MLGRTTLRPLSAALLLLLLLQESESLRRALRENHAHWASQFARSQHEAAESELALVRTIAGGGDGGGGSLRVALEQGGTATALLRRLERLEAENEELRKEQMQQQAPPPPGVAGLQDAQLGLAASAAFAASSSSSSAVRARASFSAPISPFTSAARRSFVSTPLPPLARHPFLLHCDAVLGAWTTEEARGAPDDGGVGPLQAVLHARLARASELAVKAQELCADLSLDVAAALASARAGDDSTPVTAPLPEQQQQQQQSDVRRSITALFLVLGRVPPALLSPAAAVIVLGVCGPASGPPTSASGVGSGVAAAGQPPFGSPALAAAVDTGTAVTPADIKAMVRARVRARNPPPSSAESAAAAVATPPLPPAAAAAALVPGASAPSPPSAQALRVNPPLLLGSAPPTSALPEDWLAGGPSLAAQALGSLRAGDLSADTLDAAASALSRLAVTRAHRRATVTSIVRAVAATRSSPESSTASSSAAWDFGDHPLGPSRAAAALALAAAVAEDSLPAVELYGALEALVDAFADDAAGVTRVLDDLRSWRRSIAWPVAVGPAAVGGSGSGGTLRALGRLDAQLWGRLLAWVDAEAARAAAASPTQLQQLRGVVGTIGGEGDEVLLGAIGTFDDSAMLHVVALALLVAGAVDTRRDAALVAGLDLTAAGSSALPPATRAQADADDGPIQLEDL